jgi:hypothetical protein
MLDGRGKWHRQPTQPVEWDDKNPLCERLVSLAVLIQGEWMEVGPHGSCAPFARTGANLANTYKATPTRNALGRRGDAFQMATQGTGAVEGYYFDYGFNIIGTAVEAITCFRLSYCDTTNTTGKPVVSWGDTSAYAFRLSNGDGAGNTGRFIQFLQTGTDSYRAFGNQTDGVVDFISAGKVIGSGTAPNGYVNGVLGAGINANGTGALSSNVSRIVIGTNNAIGANGSPTGCAIAGAYDRELTAEEHAALWENPWQLLRPRTARIYSFPSGGTAPTISSTNNANTLIDEATFTITGTNLASATAVTFKQATRPDYNATAFISANDATTVTLTGLDVQDMSMAYGAATVSVTTAGGTSADFAITIAEQATHQYITLSGHTPGDGWALGEASADGDQLVAALTTTLGGTFAFVGTTGAYTITYGGTAPTNDSIYWAWFDDSADQWYESTVAINPASAGGLSMSAIKRRRRPYG